MRWLSGSILAVIATVAPAAAIAADSLVVDVDFSEPVATDSFDWDGFYAGVHGQAQNGPVSGGQFGVGVNLGVNAQLEFVLVGAEVAIQGLTGGAGSTASVQALGRVGVAATDEIILYGTGGMGLDLGPAGGGDALLGGGVELALTDTVSLRGQYLRGFDLVGANPTDQVSVGANFHF